MSRAFIWAFGQGHARVVLLGSDLPACLPLCLPRPWTILAATARRWVRPRTEATTSSDSSGRRSSPLCLKTWPGAGRWSAGRLWPGCGPQGLNRPLHRTGRTWTGPKIWKPCNGTLKQNETPRAPGRPWRTTRTCSNELNNVWATTYFWSASTSANTFWSSKAAWTPSPPCSRPWTASTSRCTRAKQWDWWGRAAAANPPWPGWRWDSINPPPATSGWRENPSGAAIRPLHSLWPERCRWFSRTPTLPWTPG